MEISSDLTNSVFRGKSISSHKFNKFRKMMTPNKDIINKRNEDYKLKIKEDFLSDIVQKLIVREQLIKVIILYLKLLINLTG